MRTLSCNCHGNGEINKGIQDAQKELFRDHKDIKFGPNTDFINDKGDRYDGYHFSDKGLDKHANARLKVILK